MTCWSIACKKTSNYHDSYILLDIYQFLQKMGCTSQDHWDNFSFFIPLVHTKMINEMADGGLMVSQ